MSERYTNMEYHMANEDGQPIGLAVGISMASFRKNGHREGLAKLDAQALKQRVAMYARQEAGVRDLPSFLAEAYEWHRRGTQKVIRRPFRLVKASAFSPMHTQDQISGEWGVAA